MSVANYLNRLLGLKTEEEVKLEEQMTSLTVANGELAEENAKLRREIDILRIRLMAQEEKIGRLRDLFQQGA